MNAADGFGSETKLGPLEGAALLAGRSSFRNAAQRSSYKGLRKVVDGYFPMQAEKGDAQGRTSEPHGAEEESDGTKDKRRQAPRKRPSLMTIILMGPIAGFVFCSVCVCVCAHMSFSPSDNPSTPQFAARGGAENAIAVSIIVGAIAGAIAVLLLVKYF